MKSKPPECSGCPLEVQGQGFVPLQTGATSTSGVLLCGEAPGEKEALSGIPFVGQAGAGLNRILHTGGWKRTDFPIHNVISCRPPWNRDPTEDEIGHCSVHLEATLASLRPKVVVAMGEVALRRFCGVEGILNRRAPKRGYPYQSRVGAWTGWVVPTVHPSHIIQGASNLIGAVIADIQRAERIARTGYTPPLSKYTLDPDRLLMSDLSSEILQTVWPTTLDRKPTDFLLTLDLETDPDGSISRFSLAWGDAMRGCSMPYNADSRSWLQHVIRKDHGWKFLCVWNRLFDPPLLRREGFERLPRILDQMELWHFYQSDLPMSLGFAASLMTDFEEWKSLGESSSYGAFYSAQDAVAQHQSMLRILEQIQQEGYRIKCFERHAVALDPILERMGERGIRINKERRIELRQLLEGKLEGIGAAIDAHLPPGVVPPVVRKLLMQEVMCPRCIGEGHEPDVKANKKKYRLNIIDYEEQAGHIELIYKTGIPCARCKGDGVVGKQVRPEFEGEVHEEGWLAAKDHECLALIWTKPAPFLLKSQDHLKNYIIAKRHQLPLYKGKVCLDADAIRKQAKRYKADPVYPLILEGRKQKDLCDRFLAPAYDGVIDPDGVRRLHTDFTNVPSTWRLSSRNPNLQNVPKRGEWGRAVRRCFEPEKDEVLVEADLSAAEAVMVGYFAHDDEYVRAAKLSVHAILAAHLIGQPLNLQDPAQRLRAQIRTIKSQHKKVYARAKRVIHGTAYGMSAFLMTQLYPEEFPTIKRAQETIDLYFNTLARRVRRWQWEVLLEARRKGYLESPWGQRHYFWDALRITRNAPGGVLNEELFLAHADLSSTTVTFGNFTGEWGSQAKDALAFYPQNGTSSWMRDCLLRIVRDYPWMERCLRLQVHDSLVASVPRHQLLQAVEALRTVMEAPIPEMGGLTLGTEIKTGPNWGEMKEV